MAASLQQLTAFLQAAGARAFAWGTCDCCTWACDWVALRRGVDPSAALRGRYRTARGAGRRIATAGGLVALVARCMQGAGIEATPCPVPGDVGVVETPLGPAMAVRTTIGWAVKRETGLSVMPYVLLRAWRV